MLLCRTPLPIRRTQLRRGDRSKLKRIVQSRTAERRLVDRARIVLGSADGKSGTDLCNEIGVAGKRQRARSFMALSVW